jgi:hypothetical protein
VPALRDDLEACVLEQRAIPSRSRTEVVGEDYPHAAKTPFVRC